MFTALMRRLTQQHWSPSAGSRPLHRGTGATRQGLKLWVFGADELTYERILCSVGSHGHPAAAARATGFCSHAVWMLTVRPSLSQNSRFL